MDYLKSEEGMTKINMNHFVRLFMNNEGTNLISVFVIYFLTGSVVDDSLLLPLFVGALCSVLVLLCST